MYPFTAFASSRSVFDDDFVTTGVRRVSPTESTTDPEEVKKVKNNHFRLALHPYSERILEDFLRRHQKFPDGNVVEHLETAIAVFSTNGKMASGPLVLKYWHENFEPVALERHWREIKGDALSLPLLAWRTFSSKVNKINEFFRKFGLDLDDPQDAVAGVVVAEYDETLQEINNVLSMKRKEADKVAAFWKTLSRDMPKESANLVRYTDGSTLEVEEMVKSAMPRLLLKNTPAIAFLMKDGNSKVLPLTYNEGYFSVLDRSDSPWSWRAKDAGLTGGFIDLLTNAEAPDDVRSFNNFTAVLLVGFTAREEVKEKKVGRKRSRGGRLPRFGAWGLGAVNLQQPL